MAVSFAEPPYRHPGFYWEIDKFEISVSWSEPSYQPPGLHEEPEKSAISGTSIELFATGSPTMASKLTAERIAILHADRQEWDFL